MQQGSQLCAQPLDLLLPRLQSAFAGWQWQTFSQARRSLCCHRYCSWVFKLLTCGVRQICVSLMDTWRISGRCSLRHQDAHTCAELWPDDQQSFLQHLNLHDSFACSQASMKHLPHQQQQMIFPAAGYYGAYLQCGELALTVAPFVDR